jgi:hypothetical protein
MNAKPHDELAIHAVGNTPCGDGFAEIFDFEGAFEARGEETAEGRDEAKVAKTRCGIAWVRCGSKG